MAAYDDLPISRIVTVGLASIAITIITVLGVQVLYFGMQNYVDERKLSEGNYYESAEVLSEQTKRISRVAVDEQNGRITVPVEQTMRKMVATGSKSKSDEQKPKSNDEA